MHEIDDVAFALHNLQNWACKLLSALSAFEAYLDVQPEFFLSDIEDESRTRPNDFAIACYCQLVVDQFGLLHAAFARHMSASLLQVLSSDVKRPIALKHRLATETPHVDIGVPLSG